jgi:heme A synthase
MKGATSEMGVFRTIYRFWVSILTAAVVLQIFFAGYGAFDAAHKLDDKGSTIDQDSFENSFNAHTGFGYMIFLGALVLLLLSFGARGRARILRSLGVVLLVMLQIVLAWIGYGVPYVAGGLHPINAFIILGLLGSMTYREWKVERVAAPEPVPATPSA